MTRTEIINNFITKYNYQSYCEVGTFNRSHNFNKIKCPYKYCIDPDPKAKADYVGTSDSFFRSFDDAFDIYFIDGFHSAIQVYKDIYHALDHLNTGGTILVHDMLPTSKECQQVPRIQGEWTGDCWMAFVWLRATVTHLKMYTINADYGIGVIQKGKQDLITINENITYENFEKNKHAWLNLVAYENVLSQLS